MKVAGPAAPQERLANSGATEHCHRQTQFDGLDNRFHLWVRRL